MMLGFHKARQRGARFWCAALPLCITLGGAASPAFAATVRDVQVHHRGSRYEISARLVVDVGRPAAYRAATSFEAIAAQSRLIKHSRRLGDHRLSSVLSLCVLFYCKQVTQVMTYQLDAPETLRMQVVPGAGDFSAGHADWRFESIGPDKTRIVFTSDMTPTFWVPPMIGDWAIAHALRGQIADTGRAIEAVAQRQSNTQHPGGDADTDASAHAD